MSTTALNITVKSDQAIKDVNALAKAMLGLGTDSKKTINAIKGFNSLNIRVTGIDKLGQSLMRLKNHSKGVSNALMKISKIRVAQSSLKSLEGLSNLNFKTSELLKLSKVRLGNIFSGNANSLDNYKKIAVGIRAISSSASRSIDILRKFSFQLNKIARDALTLSKSLDFIKRSNIDGKINKISAEVNQLKRSVKTSTTAIKKKGNEVETTTRKMGLLSRAFNLATGASKKLATLGVFSLLHNLQLIKQTLTNVIQAFIEFADLGTKISNSIDVVSLSAEEFDKNLNRVLDVSKTTKSSIEGMSVLYNKLSLSQDALGASADDVADIMKTLGSSLRATGADSNAQRAVLLQAGQALGEGTVRATEFNAVLENATPIVNGLEKLFKTGGRSFRTFVGEGLVSSKDFSEGLIELLPYMDALASKARVTISQGLLRMKETLGLLLSEMLKATGVSDFLAKSFDKIADKFVQLTKYIINNKEEFIATIKTAAIFSVAIGVTATLSILKLTGVLPLLSTGLSALSTSFFGLFGLVDITKKAFIGIGKNIAFLAVGIKKLSSSILLASLSFNKLSFSMVANGTRMKIGTVLVGAYRKAINLATISINLFKKALISTGVGAIFLAIIWGMIKAF